MRRRSKELHATTRRCRSRWTTADRPLGFPATTLPPLLDRILGSHDQPNEDCMRTGWALMAVVATAAYGSERPVADEITFEAGLEYAKADGQSLQLDLARPKT